MRQPLTQRPGRPSLLVVVNGEATTHALPDAGDVVIGRAPECDVAIDHPSVSRRHAILRTGPRFALEDLGSANGTRVRGRVIDGGAIAELAPGEVFDIGATALVIQTEALEAPAATGRPGVDPMRELQRMVELIAPGRLPVLLVGETGAGKEVVARALHAKSPRAERPFLVFHCAAVPETLLESEMFGHERGAFTGAVQARPGLFELAAGGTVFLDEIGELPASVQVKLLRVLEDRAFLRVGAVTPRPLDVRFIAATHRDLAAEVTSGRFRQDLYFRVNGATLRVPPLRERAAEIEPLARAFLAEAATGLGRVAPALSPEALDALRRRAWPGNVRELRHVIERAVLLAGEGPIAPKHLPTAEPTREAPPRDDDRGRIEEALRACGGNQSRAAELLGISRRTLTKRLGALGMPRPIKDRR